MRLNTDFTGGNITVTEQKNNVFYLENQLRDTKEDWFYWAFCVENAGGETLTFNFQNNRIGHFGPAVSRDLENWFWLESCDGDSFTYSFKPDENKVYFAHDMLYHPERFYRFAKENGLEIKKLCKTKKNRTVPFVEFGQGNKTLILTARHHACESTGSYVLEGVLTELLKNPIPDTKVFCVPFVDFDGVLDGDQGKGRTPHDHNRDYPKDGTDSIYNECKAIRDYADKNGCTYAFDFHSPWHKDGQNDRLFIVQNSIEKLPVLNRFGEILEEKITETAMKYYHKNDFPPNTDWNRTSPNFGQYMSARLENIISFSFETAYFGDENNKISQVKMKETGICFAKALKEYDKNENS